MAGIKAWILCRDFRVIETKFESHVSHLHYKNGSYLNIEKAILNKSVSDVQTDKLKPAPRLAFQEGNAIPKGVQDVYNHIQWELWHMPKERGMHGKVHGKGIGLGKIFNMKTLPLIVLGVATLAYILNSLQGSAAPPPIENLPFVP